MSLGTSSTSARCLKLLFILFIALGVLGLANSVVTISRQSLAVPLFGPGNDGAGGAFGGGGPLYCGHGPKCL
jgi:hypothetical protein